MEVMLGRPVIRRSPARLGRKSRAKVAAAMAEVYRDTPSTVERANVHGAKKTAMLRAIAFSKARARGARVPARKGSRA